jgi:hypothetical protein
MAPGAFPARVRPDYAVEPGALWQQPGEKEKSNRVSRRLLVDIWKMRTGRTTAQQLGLVLNTPGL